MTERNNWPFLAEMSESQEESANPKVPSVEGRVKRLWRLGLSRIGLTWPILPSTSLPKISTGTCRGRQCNETTSHPSDPLSVKPRRGEPPYIRKKMLFLHCKDDLSINLCAVLCWLGWQPNHPSTSLGPLDIGRNSSRPPQPRGVAMTMMNQKSRRCQTECEVVTRRGRGGR